MIGCYRFFLQAPHSEKSCSIRLIQQINGIIGIILRLACISHKVSLQHSDAFRGYRTAVDTFNKRGWEGSIKKSLSVFHLSKSQTTDDYGRNQAGNISQKPGQYRMSGFADSNRSEING